MNFTFGIITNNNITNLSKIINSIEMQNIPNYEIIIVGCNTHLNKKNCICIPFDESIYPGWITRKKNIITKYAKYENIVYMHDYIELDEKWYCGFLNYGNTFDVLINPIQNLDGSRFRDWILNINFLCGKELLNGQRTRPVINAPDEWIQINENVVNKYNIDMNNKTHYLSYDDDGKHWQKYIYISGSYFVVKKYVIEEFPLNENLLHGQGEDVDWIQSLHKKYVISFNNKSISKLLKQKI
jgi:hypothetical protein